MDTNSAIRPQDVNTVDNMNEQTFKITEDKFVATKQVQESLNQQWETEFYPVVYQLFHKDAKPQMNGNYYEILNQYGTGRHCDFDSMKFTEIEISCNICASAPTEKQLTALFTGSGQQRAFNWLKQRVMSVCCQTLNWANYIPHNKISEIGSEYFEQFINDVLHSYWRRINANLTMSKIKLIPSDSSVCTGFMAYITISLWIEVKKEPTSLLDAMLEG